MNSTIILPSKVQQIEYSFAIFKLGYQLVDLLESEFTFFLNWIRTITKNSRILWSSIRKISAINKK